jgi:imidazolonepropionase-like amidohydrolase
VILLVLGVAPLCPAQKLAIVGGTLIDLDNYGHSANDIANSVVLIDEGRIIAVGPASQLPVPLGTARINAHGRFLIPGLIAIAPHSSHDLNLRGFNARKQQRKEYSS